MPDQYTEILVPFIATVIIALSLVGFVVIIVKRYNEKKRAQEKEILVLKTVFEKELLKTRLEIQEEVLKNISMEVHDNIGQELLLANINVSILQSLDLPPQAPALITETKQLLGKISEDIIRLSRNLHSDRITETGVFLAIIHDLELLENKGLYTIHILNEDEQTGRDLPKETQLLVFRMYQEIVKNIIKHAKADQIGLQIVKNENGIELMIKDNGVGFEYKKPEENKLDNSNGVGMRSLLSRVALFNGKIAINSVLQRGTEINIFIPQPKRAGDIR